jgi:hypothetical protein
MSRSSDSSASRHRPHDEKQDYGTDEGNHNGAEQAHRTLDEEPDQKESAKL